MTWFWDACRIALWDICCTLTTMWREYLKIQARDKNFFWDMWRTLVVKTTILVCKSWLFVVRGFWDVVWVKSVMEETQHIWKTVLRHVVLDMVGHGFEMHCHLCTTQKICKKTTHVDGWKQNLRSISAICGKFVIHVLFLSFVWCLHNNLMNNFLKICV